MWSSRSVPHLLKQQELRREQLCSALWSRGNPSAAAGRFSLGGSVLWEARGETSRRQLGSAAVAASVQPMEGASSPSGARSGAARGEPSLQQDVPGAALEPSPRCEHRPSGWPSVTVSRRQLLVAVPRWKDPTGVLGEPIWSTSGCDCSAGAPSQRAKLGSTRPGHRPVGAGVSQDASGVGRVDVGVSRPGTDGSCN